LSVVKTLRTALLLAALAALWLPAAIFWRFAAWRGPSKPRSQMKGPRMTLDKLIRHLESCGLSPRKTGSGWQARCAGHDDHNASLSIAEGKDGRILLKCFAGCSVESIVGALGLKMSDLFPARAKEHHDQKPRIVATYDYRDEAGKLLFQCVRYEPKKFKQRRPDPQKAGAWIWDLKNTRRILYRLPQVLAALAAGRTTFIAEGEKDCDALAQAGFVATCNPMGAGKWLPEHTSTLRAAARIVVIADKDEPGRKHAQSVAAAIQGTVKSVKLIELPDVNGKPVKDAYDFLAAGGTADELRAIVKAAPEWPVVEPKGSGKNGGTKEPDEQVFARLAALSAAEYDRCRDNEAKRLGVRTLTLDAEVAKRRQNRTNNGQGCAVELPNVEPWPEAVDGASVLAAVADTFSRYVVLPPSAADALALWAAHTHCFEAFLHTPRLNLYSPDKGCGKTTALDVLASLTPRPLRTESMTAAVLFRLVEGCKPTLLLDEIDSYLSDAEELRGLLNAGHRRGAKAYRCEGDNNEVRGFAAFAPAALAGIGALPGTLHDRSIVIRLTRAKPGEVAARFDSRHIVAETELCRKLAQWGADNFASLEGCDPHLPEGAFNRLADNWRPLFAIAEIAGGDWPQRAAAAFAKLTSGDDLDAQGVGTMLLADIAGVFAAEGVDKLFSVRLADRLAAIEGRLWAEYGKNQKPITPNQLAKLLRCFDISPRTIRLADETAKGYELPYFTEAFERFLPNSSVPKRHTVTTPENIGGFRLSEPSQPNSMLRIANAVPANKDADCDGVTVRKPDPGPKKEAAYV
jgi:hypothetical protein